MAPLRASLEVFREAGMAALRRKSIALTAYLEALIAEQLPHVLRNITPSAAAERGCQLSLQVRAGREQGRALFEYLVREGVIGDWREPDVIRLSPAPLYNRFSDCHAAVAHIKRWSELA
jgi:kynureninase